MGCEIEDYIHLVQNRDQGRAILNTVLNLRVPSNPRNSLSGSATLSSLRIQFHGDIYLVVSILNSMAYLIKIQLNILNNITSTATWNAVLELQQPF
jgi:hypothetical protein